MKQLTIEKIIDSFVILWFAFSLITWCLNKTAVSNTIMQDRSLLVCLYFFFRLAINKFGRYARGGLLIILFLGYWYELLLGYLQLFEIVPTSDYYNLLLGSFKDPGPYGGFIAICDSIFIAFFINNKDKKYKTVLIISFIFGIILLPSIRSRAAILSLVLSLFLLFFKTNRQLITKYIIIIISIFALAVIAAYFYKKPSAEGRFFMTKICTRAMFNNNLLGNGFGSFEGVYGNEQFIYFNDKMNGSLDYSLINENERLVSDCPSNSFNDYLKIGIESGLHSLFLFLGILGCSLGLALKHGSNWSYGLLAFMVFAFFFSVSNVLIFNVLLALILSSCVSCKNEYDKTVNYYSIPLIVSTFCIILFLIPSTSNYSKTITKWNGKTYKQYLREKYDLSIVGCDTVQSILSNYPNFLFVYGRAHNKIGNYSKSDSILKIGSKISDDPMFWNVMGNNSLALGNYREAEERYKHAFIMVPNRMYPLYLLANLYYTEGDTAGFIKMSKMIESFIPKVESVSTVRMRSEIKEMAENIYLGEE